MSIRSFVVCLALCVTGPLLIFEAFVLVRSALEEQKDIAQTVLARASDARSDLDRELRALREPLSVLAAAYDPVRGETGAFQNLAEQVLQHVGLAVTLGEPAPPAVTHDSQNPGTADCSVCRQDEQMDATAEKLPSLSDLTYSPEHSPSVTMDLPVRRVGGPTLVLSLDIRPRIDVVLQEQHFPPGWLGFVLDRKGVVLASTANDAGLAVGAEQSAFTERAAGAGRAMVVWPLPGGTRLHAATSRLTGADWTVGVGVSHAIAFAPLRRSLISLAAAAGAALTTVGLLAVFVGGRVSGPVAALALYADRLGPDGAAAFPPTGIIEVDDVARSLALSSARLRAGNAALVRTADALRRRRRTLRALTRKLRRALVERTALLQRLVDTEEAERRRIARDLHDRLGQYLVSLSLGLSELERTGPDDARADRLREMRRISTEVGREVHRLAYELRPTVLDDFGLQGAAAQYVEAWGDRLGLAVDFASDLETQRFEPGREIALYRVLQEAMTNVARHACATRVSVILSRVGRSIRLIVEDDGSGFCTGLQQQEQAGFGLRSIRERMSLLGGTVQLESAPGNGTTLLCSVPVS